MYSFSSVYLRCCRLEEERDISGVDSSRAGSRLQDDGQTNSDQHGNKTRHINTDRHVNTEKHVSIDGQEKCEGARYSMALFKKSMSRLWAVKPTDTTASHRQLTLQDRFRTGFEFFTYDSGHNPTTVLISHLHLIHVESLESPGQFTTGVAVDKGMRKSHANHEQYSILLREKNVEICPVGALAFYLLAIWTVRLSLLQRPRSCSLYCCRVTYIHFAIFSAS
jgi:hypothetical protein